LVLALTSRGQWFDSVVGVLKKIERQSPTAKDQVKCAIMVNHMIHFHNRASNKRSIRGTTEEIAKFLKLPIEIVTRLLDLFTTTVTDDRGEESYAISKQTRDKCLVHMFIVYLMAHGLKMATNDVLPLGKDVKLEPQEAATILRAAGCTVTSKGVNTMRAELKIPLKFPPPKRGRGGQS